MDIQNIIYKTNQFINELETPKGFKLFKRSEVSPYARCFVIFTKSLLKQFDWLNQRKEKLIYDLNTDLHQFYKEEIKNSNEWKYDKSFLQLYCFSLSALNILNGSLDNKNFEIFEEILKIDIIQTLQKKGVDKGIAKSGNHSMFFAVFNIYANNYLNIDRSKQIQEWLQFNSNAINSNGFWGQNIDMDYLQFQNGYHQYEIFEHLNFEKAPWNIAAQKIFLMTDKYGHFAPWPGGGACYDYDAIFMLTSKFVQDFGQNNVLKRTLNSVIKEQNFDGGFCESRQMGKNLWSKFLSVIDHLISQPSHIRFWSLYVNLNLFRFKHRNIITHWSHTNRKWDESNAWDTFFRLSTIYRICNRLNLREKDLFKINNFPGIG